MGYLIGDGHGWFIRQDPITGKYVPVKNQVLATEWPERHKAANILKSCVKRQERAKYHVIDIPATIETTINEQEPEEPVQVKDHTEDIKAIAGKEKPKTKMDEWKEAFDKIMEVVKSTEERRNELSNELSKIDLEISDIQHYIETSKLNCAKGYSAYVMLRERLKARRIIKDEILFLNTLGGCPLESVSMMERKEVMERIDHQVYKPRVLTELFE